jgi:hypothetical protein
MPRSTSSAGRTERQYLKPVRAIWLRASGNEPAPPPSPEEVDGLVRDLVRDHVRDHEALPEWAESPAREPVRAEGRASVPLRTQPPQAPPPPRPETPSSRAEIPSSWTETPSSRAETPSPRPGRVYDGGRAKRATRWLPAAAIIVVTLAATWLITTHLREWLPGSAPTSAASSPAVHLGGPGQPLRLEYPDFSDASGLVLAGDARAAGSAIRLTDGAGQTGAVWSPYPLDPAHSFAAAFRLAPTVDTGPVAFLLQTHAVDVNPPRVAAGPYLTVTLQPAATVNGTVVHPSLRVTFATAGADVPTVLVEGRPSIEMADEPATIWVDYSAVTKTLEVFVGAAGAKPALPLLSTKLVLTDVLGAGPAYAGFTAAANDNDARHDVLAWFLSGRG